MKHVAYLAVHVKSSSLVLVEAALDDELLKQG